MVRRAAAAAPHEGNRHGTKKFEWTAERFNAGLERSITGAMVATGFAHVLADKLAQDMASACSGSRKSVRTNPLEPEAAGIPPIPSLIGYMGGSSRSFVAETVRRVRPAPVLTSQQREALSRLRELGASIDDEFDRVQLRRAFRQLALKRRNGGTPIGRRRHLEIHIAKELHQQLSHVNVVVDDKHFTRTVDRLLSRHSPCLSRVLDVVIGRRTTFSNSVFTLFTMARQV